MFLKFDLDEQYSLLKGTVNGQPENFSEVFPSQRPTFATQRTRSEIAAHASKQLECLPEEA